MSGRDNFFATIGELVMQHSPSGVEEEIDGFLRGRFAELGLTVEMDPSGNLITRIPGKGKGRLAITAHKDEIGGVVTAVEDGGKLKVRNVGGSFPWVYGEGVVDLLADRGTISGILSFGSRHVSELSPQFAFKANAALRWKDAWIETKRTRAELEQAGVRPGTRMVIGKHRKAPFRLGDYIASYTLDNKGAVAIMLELMKRLKDPHPEIIFIISAKEEVGAIGAMYYTQHYPVDALIALEICPVAPEYPVIEGPTPVLIAEDSNGQYDNSLIKAIAAAASDASIPLQMAVLSCFGSDGSISMKAGHVGRAACLGFPTQNTHGYEITHLDALENCVRILETFCRRDILSL